MEGYLSGIEHLTLDNYVTYQAGTEDLSQYGLDDPELTVTVTYTPEEDEEGESQTFTLHISRSPEERAAAENDTASEEDEEEEITAYARVGDSEIVYQITGESYEALMAAGYDDLRHKEALTADFTQVTGLDITLEGTVYNLTSEGSGEDKTFRFGGGGSGRAGPALGPGGAEGRELHPGGAHAEGGDRPDGLSGPCGSSQRADPALPL